MLSRKLIVPVGLMEPGRRRHQAQELLHRVSTLHRLVRAIQSIYREPGRLLGSYRVSGIMRLIACGTISGGTAPMPSQPSLISGRLTTLW